AGIVPGLQVRTGGGLRAIRARSGVILACGGFEAAPEMQAQFWQGKPVLSAAVSGNTGDGIRMAQDLGADLWHMWHYHGSYGFRHPDPAYPYGIRTKRLPDWLPGEGPRGDVTMTWIVLDRSGRRFMNEYAPYLQDTGARPLDLYLPELQDFPRIPCWLVTDTQGGPVHDADQRVLDAFGAPIPRLYAAGELGSAFGHLYMSGGNIAECFIGGRLAGQGAAAETRW